MTVRQSGEMTLQVGQDVTLDEKIFDGAITLLSDACEHATSHVYTLDAVELNAAVDFGDVAEARLIWIESDGGLDISIGGIPGVVATLLGGAGSFPTNFVGGELFSFGVDGVTVAGTFEITDQSVQQCVNRLNATAMLAGLGFVPFVVESGRIRVNGALASAAGEIEVLTINATIGFAALTSTNGTDASGSSAPQILETVAVEGGETAFYVSTVKTSSLVISNRESRITNVRVCIVGDVTA